MTHPRQTIRDAVVALLIAHPTAAAGNVKASWRWPFAEGQVPAITVWTSGDSPFDEEGDRGHRSLATRGIRRHVQLTIEARVAEAASAETAIDDLCREIEQAIESDPYLSATLEQCFYDGTDIEPTAADQDPPGFTATLTYTCVLADDWT